MGLFKLFQKRESSVVVQEKPHEKVYKQMTDEGRLIGLFAKDGEFLTDQLGESRVDVRVENTFYLAMNLNFVESFYNTVQVGVYDSGDELVSAHPKLYKLAYHLGDDLVVETNSKGTGPKVNVADYEKGILLTMLKLPQDWRLPENGQILVKVQASMIFNPGELESYILKLAN